MTKANSCYHMNVSLIPERLGLRGKISRDFSPMFFLYQPTAIMLKVYCFNIYIYCIVLYLLNGPTVPIQEQSLIMKGWAMMKYVSLYQVPVNKHFTYSRIC